MERLIFQGADHSDIEREAVAAGMIPMFEAGLHMVLEGSTTLQELERTLQSDG
jgi:general secretion pathway protein E